MNNEVNVWLEQVFEFLSKELSLLENELKKRLLTVTENKIDLHNVFKYFFFGTCTVPERYPPGCL